MARSSLISKARAQEHNSPKIIVFLRVKEKQETKKEGDMGHDDCINVKVCKTRGKVGKTKSHGDRNIIIWKCPQ